MAVPKKKISHSKTRKRLLSKTLSSRKYIQCKESSNFIPLHSVCLDNFKDHSSKYKTSNLNRKSITNILIAYDNEF